MVAREGTECRVRGPLGWALRVSRLAGVAPLRFRPLRGGWRVVASPALDLYSKIITITWCVLAAAGLLLDLYAAPERSLRSSTVSNVIVYSTDLTVMTAAMLAAGFTGMRRMNCLIGCFARLQKINSELNLYRRSSSGDRNKWLILLALLVSGLFTFTLDFGLFMELISLEYARTRSMSAVVMASMYIFYICLYATRLVIQIQFSLVALTVVGTLRTINDRLKDLLDDIRLEAPSVRSPMMLKTTYYTHSNLNRFKIPVTSINSIIDSLATMDRITMAAARPRRAAAAAAAAAAAVRRLASARATAGLAVRRLDRSHGPMLLAVTFSSLVHIVISSYCLACCFVTVIHSRAFLYNPVMQALWAVFHVSGLLTVIEPAHRTQQEMDNTKRVVSQLIQSTATSDARLGAELELFVRRLAPEGAAFAPMNMCTINRQFIATMLGTIITYLVVVIQL